MADRGLESAETEQEGGTLKRVSWIVLCASLVLLFAHVFIPTHQFIHRGDDAFYYFETAVNHVRHGFWSFDSTTPRVRNCVLLIPVAIFGARRGWP